VAEDFAKLMKRVRGTTKGYSAESTYGLKSALSTINSFDFFFSFDFYLIINFSIKNYRQILFQILWIWSRRCARVPHNSSAGACKRYESRKNQAQIPGIRR